MEDDWKLSVSKTVSQGALGFKWKEKLFGEKCGFKVPPAHMADKYCIKTSRTKKDWISH